MQKIQNKLSLSIILLYILSIGIYFWTQSRYPQLEGKAGTGISTPTPDLISFDAIMKHSIGEPWIHEIFISLINWCYTNWKGMTFGLLFGIGVLTLIHFIDIKKLPKNKFTLAIIGLLNGFGLGVCANCSTPIGKSIISSGIHPIVGINTIISSPSFNVIAIGLLFSIFPWYIAVLQLSFYIIIIFLVVPYIFHDSSQVQKKNKSCNIGKLPKSKNISRELLYLLKVFLLNTKFILTRTFPLMILGGLIGVIIASFITDSLINSLDVNIVNITIASIISFLLPVPMLFNIIFSGIVYESSIPSIFSFILLLNLGGFSIYPLLVLSQDIKFKKLLIFSCIFISLSGLASLIMYKTKLIHDTSNIGESLYKKTSIIESDSILSSRNYIYLDTINALSEDEINSILKYKHSHFTTKNIKNREPFEIPYSYLRSQDNIDIYSSNISEKQNFGDFQVLYDKQLGVNNHGYRFSLMFAGVGISDYNNDGWEDIILPSANGVHVYKNIGGFFQKDTDILAGSLLESEEVNLANFYDLDGDNWKDFLVVTRNQGVFILWNNNGLLDISNPTIIDISVDKNSSTTLSLGDLFESGYIDIFIGEAAGISRGKNLQSYILKNLGNRKFDVVWVYKNSSGANFGSIIWDFDEDGKNELYKANASEHASDVIFQTFSQPPFISPIDSMKSLIPVTTLSQMGIIPGDIDNDLKYEYFIPGNEEYDPTYGYKYPTSCVYPKSGNVSMDFLEQKTLACELKEIVALLANRQKCELIKNPYLQDICSKILSIAISPKIDKTPEKIEFCESLKGSYHFGSFYEYCTGGEMFQKKTLEIGEDIMPQTDNNILLKENSQGLKENIVSSVTDLDTGWSWGAFFADLDNNTFQDLYIANGYIRNHLPGESNKLLMNYEGQLTNKHKELGVENYLDTLTASYIDYDNDGDLDILTTTIFNDLVFYENNLKSGNSISFDLIDLSSQNTESIGAKIIITTPDGNRQVRDIYIGGSFMSLQNTNLHFGIGNSNTISRAEVIWPDGDKTYINTPLEGNKKYIIKRNK